MISHFLAKTKKISNIYKQIGILKASQKPSLKNETFLSCPFSRETTFAESQKNVQNLARICLTKAVVGLLKRSLLPSSASSVHGVHVAICRPREAWCPRDDDKGSASEPCSWKRLLCERGGCENLDTFCIEETPVSLSSLTKNCQWLLRLLVNVVCLFVKRCVRPTVWDIWGFLALRLRYLLDLFVSLDHTCLARAQRRKQVAVGE